MSELKSYRVWDALTRWFHWINALCVLLLVLGGLLILYGRSLGIQDAAVRLMMKKTHVWVGYVFAVNLLVRFVWAFVGNRYARWRAFLPFGRGYLSAAWSYIAAFFSSHPQHYLGHNPLGRLSVTVIFLLIAALAVSGLVLASTDLFYPPIGHWIAKRIAAPGVDPGTLVPSTPSMYDKAAYESMRAFRKPFILVHLYGFYALVALVGLHVAAVIVTEIREGGTLISATFTGKRIVAGRPVDEAQSSAG
jgi:Ni/Fe-hydrogenase 1 B-type cytochrome subunit